MTGIIDEIQRSFKNGNYLTKLIYINIAVWVLIRLVFVGCKLSGSDSSEILDWLAMPASADLFISRPWTIVTYMFLHFELLHILFNVLWLYWFGKIFLEYHNEKTLLSLYLFGGLAGGLTYMAAFNLIPVFHDASQSSSLMGASASVVAIVVAIAYYVPNHIINLLFIGPVKIKWIALISVLLYIINLSGNNAGGNFAHLGGALWGWLYMSQLVSGKNLTGWFERMKISFPSLLRPRKRLKVKHNAVNPDYNYNRSKTLEQEEINRVLDKIGSSGYDSLTHEEREVLFNMSKKIRK